MSETTTISVHPDTKERLKNYCHPDAAESWTDNLEAMMNALPPTSRFNDGCYRCDSEPFRSHPGEEPSGVIQYFHDDVGEQHVAHWFCSWECLAETMEANQKWVPEQPDLVVIGGHEQMRAEVKGATFYIDQNTKEVGIPVPGAFDGESDQGDAYDYVGEPIYIYHAGEYRHQGVIDKIFHEEAHTGIVFRSGTPDEYGTVMENHPDSELRRRYLENRIDQDASA